MNVGYIIKKYREKVFPGQGGLTECAEKLGISKQALSRWESGGRTPKRSNIKELARVFGIDFDDFQKEIAKAEDAGIKAGTSLTRYPLERSMLRP